MTRKERLTRCYRYQEVDRPAVYSRTGFPADDPTYDALKAYLDEYTELKAGWNGSRLEMCESPRRTEEPYSDDFTRRVETLSTPKGTLTRTSLVSTRGKPGLHETFYIKNERDAERYLSLPEPEIEGDVSTFFDTERAVGDKGIADVHVGLNPAGFVAELCGSERFALFSIDNRDLLHRLCERRLRITKKLITYLLDRKVGPFFSLFGQEYIVPPLHGPTDFDDFNVKYDKLIIDLIHDSGGVVHVHSHGSIHQVIGGFTDMGADVLHPFEGPPQGNISPTEAKTHARGVMCLEGNIQIHRMYEAEPAEIREETQRLIRDIFDDGRGLIVSPTASPYIRGEGEKCLSRYRAMIETVMSYSAC